MNIDEIEVGMMVGYARFPYTVAEIKDFHHGKMVGIYDEPPSKHIDYVTASSLSKIYHCPDCQNGCPTCGGFGYIEW